MLRIPANGKIAYLLFVWGGGGGCFVCLFVFFLFYLSKTAVNFQSGNKALYFLKNGFLMEFYLVKPAASNKFMHRARDQGFHSKPQSFFPFFRFVVGPFSCVNFTSFMLLVLNCLLGEQMVFAFSI